MPTFSTRNPFLNNSPWLLTNFGFDREYITERHPIWFYPTVNDQRPAGVFLREPNKFVAGDFNGDGFEDIYVAWTYIPHTVPHLEPNTPSLYINNGRSGFTETPIVNYGNPMMNYRAIAADFNGDGFKDIAQQGSYNALTNVYDDIRIVYKSGTTFQTAVVPYRVEPNTTRIPHEISAGDFNGDSRVDIFVAGYIFENQGNLLFTQRSDAFPYIDPTYYMSSVAADFNNDGLMDLFVGYAEGFSGYIALNQGNYQWQTQRITSGVYGSNTKFNHATAGDIDGDGDQDLVVAETKLEPYYVGRSYEIFINDGRGHFTNETLSRLPVVDRSLFGGEGQLSLLDFEGDGDLDLFDSATVGQTSDGKHLEPGFTLALNDGKGNFQYFDVSKIPQVKGNQLAGYESTRGDQLLDVVMPVNIDGVGLMDFLGFVRTPLTQWPQVEPNETTVYTLVNNGVITGTASADRLTGTAAGDKILGLAGNDTIDGAEGQDTAVYASALNQNTITYDFATSSFTISTRNQGRDTVKNVEIFEFSDATVSAASLIMAPNTIRLNEAEISTEMLYKAYLAYFGRPPDMAGLSYFSTATQSQVIAAFSQSQESQDLYRGQTLSDQVNSIYQNLFGRDAEPLGLNYWVNEIQSGRVSLAGAAFVILGSAQNLDALTVTAKMEVMQAFVQQLQNNGNYAAGYSGNVSATIAREYLAEVYGASSEQLTHAKTQALATVEQALNQISAAGSTFALTRGFADDTVLDPGIGNNIINTMSGTDTVVYLGSRSDYIVTKTATGYTVVNSGTPLNNTLIQNAEFLKFSDATVSLERISVPGQYTDVTGTKKSDVLMGTSGPDIINGKAGNDILRGRGGSDLFVFDTVLKSNLDRIVDFDSNDTILLDSEIFTKFLSSELTAENFVVGTGARDSDDYLIFNPQKNVLYYDADGSAKKFKPLSVVVIGSNFDITVDHIDII